MRHANARSLAPLSGSNDDIQADNRKVLTRLGLGAWADFDRCIVEREEQSQIAGEMAAGLFRIGGLTLSCPPGVYHPGLRSSSLFLLRHLQGVALPPRPRILEVGVGSGAILLSLALQQGAGTFVGVDSDTQAIATAAANADRNNVSASLRHSDLFQAIGPDERFDMIVFNPPLYDKWPRNPLERQTLCDPGGRLLRRFIADFSRFLSPGGAAYVAISNIGCLSPLATDRCAVTLIGAEIFLSGQLLALVRLTPLPGQIEAGKGR